VAPLAYFLLMLPADFLARVRGHSPYLSDLAQRDPQNLRVIAANGPDALCDQALSQLARLTPTLPRAELAAALRTQKRAVALAAAFADITGAWSLAEITGALSDLADGALRVAVAHLLRQAAARGHIRLPHPAAPDRGSGFTVLALGKLGARELNFSSDVDLILLYDPDAQPDQAALGQTMTRLARDLIGLMSARDASGYVFRVDLRLRPDPASTPLAVALPAAYAYYESLGQTWERAALIKARPVAGDLALGRRFLDAIVPFIWRRHLDFAAIGDIHGMKRRMDAHRGTALGRDGPIAARVLGQDVKLGEGGIREVEFCAQTLQLVWGGRIPALRVPATLAALDAAEHSGHLPAATVSTLKDAYIFLRIVEHRLQMVADRQTHLLPAQLPELENFSRFLGYADATVFATVALAHMNAVHAVFEGMFAASQPKADEPTDSSQPQSAIAAGWLAGRPRAFRTERGRALVVALLPAIEAAVARQTEPDAAMVRLDAFFHQLPAGVQILSMLAHNPALLDRLADVAGAAPWLADHLAEVPAALEGLAAPESFAADPAALLDTLLRDARGLDDALQIASRLVRAEEFAAAAGEFFGRIDADEAGRRRTALAEAVIGILLRRVLADHEGRYGRVRGGAMVVVALGKAGSGDMMAGSDLDLMLIYDHPADAESTGRRALPASQYFARAAQAVIAALTVPTRHGPLYQVDMRLRPSGNKGPVAVSLASFETYHRETAWTWERLALTRARIVAGPAALRRRVAAAIGAALRQNNGRVRRDTAEMRARLLRDLPPRGAWDVRRRAGGLMEVEFVVQALMLEHARRPRVLAVRTRDGFANLARARVLPQEDADMLIAADRFWRTLQGLMRIALGRQVPACLPPPLLEKLLQATGAGSDEAALRARADEVAGNVRAAFVRHVGDIGIS